MKRRHTFNLLLLAAAAFLFIPAVVGAQINCGDTVGPDGHFMLTGDLHYTTKPAFTIAGPVNVDLKGYTVSCDSILDDGIVIIGDGAHLQNGTVTGCGDAVSTDEESNDLFILNIVAQFNNSEGFKIAGSRNRLVSNTSQGNTNDGFELEGDDLELIGNLSVDNTGTGFQLEGFGSQIRANYSIDNGDEGFDVEGGNNRLSGNVAQYNRDDGIQVEGDAGNVVTANTSSFNLRKGISIENDGIISGNEVVENGGDGIRVIESNNDIHGNRVFDNGLHGIRVEEEGEGNTIQGNRVLGHENDLRDDNDTCTLNKWLGNTFDTSDPDCIR